jgi:hypothetical protein
MVGMEGAQVNELEADSAWQVLRFGGAEPEGIGPERELLERKRVRREGRVGK